MDSQRDWASEQSVESPVPANRARREGRCDALRCRRRNAVRRADKWSRAVVEALIGAVLRLAGYRSVRFSFRYGRKQGTVRVWLRTPERATVPFGTLLAQLRSRSGFVPGGRLGRELAEDLVDSRGVFRRGFMVAVNGLLVRSLGDQIRVEDHVEVFVVPAFGGG